MMLVARLLGVLLCLICSTSQANFAIFQVNGPAPPATCDVTRNITDFGAVGSGLVNDAPAFSGTGSFNDWAVNTWQPSNPGTTICLNLQTSARYFFGGSGVSAPTQNIKSLVINFNGSTMTQALKLPTNAPTLAGSAVIHFSSVPSGVLVGQGVVDENHSAALNGPTVQSINSPLPGDVTLTSNISAPGVSSGDIISFHGKGYFLGGQGQFNNNTSSALVQTVSAGASTVTVASTTPFTANRWGLITGIDLEGGGFPQNPYYFEYVFITNVNAGTNQITFQSPLQNSYESTWPNYNLGSAFQINLGGPATLYAMDPSWDTTLVLNDCNIDQWDGSGGTFVNIDGRSITLNNCTFPSWAANISQQSTVTFNNPNASASPIGDVDKVWVTATINGGSINGWKFFSGSNQETMTLNGVHVFGSLQGTPGKFVINNSTLDQGLQMGATSNGITLSVTCSNSALTAGIAQGGIFDPNMTGVTLVGGLMTIPRTTESPIPWAVPGGDFYLSGTVGGFGALFKNPFSVTDITDDATNTYVQTTLPGGFPGGTNTSVRAAPSKNINFTHCTGDPVVVDWSQAGAQNARPYTYSNRIYTCTNNVATIQAANPGVPVIDINSPPSNEPVMARSIVSMVANVSTADTSVNATVHFNPTGQFHYPTMDASGTFTDWVPVINLKTVGTRTYTGSTASWSGLQTGDTGATMAASGLLTGPMQPFTGTNISGDAAGTCPVVTVTIQTN